MKAQNGTSLDRTGGLPRRFILAQKLNLAGIFAVVFFALTVAASFSAVAGNTGEVHLSNVGQWNRVIVIQTIEPIQNPANCENSHSYQLDNDHLPDFARAMLISALVADMPVRLYIHDEVCSVNNQPSVRAVMLRPEGQ